MTIFNLTILACFLVATVTLIGGYLPIWLAAGKKTQYLFALSNSFARGIFLGIGFIHLLPEASLSLTQTFGSTSFSIISAICALTIITLLFLEQSLSDFFKEKEAGKNIPWLPYLLAIMLSTHSVLAGAALGLEQKIASFIAIFTAIVIHKGSEAFALSTSLYSHHLKKQAHHKIIILFSLMTPLGILSGASLSSILDSNSGKISAAIFSAIAAGTFIYIAVLDKLNTCNHCSGFEKISNVTNLCAIYIGFAVIGSMTFIVL